MMTRLRYLTILCSVLIFMIFSAVAGTVSTKNKNEITSVMNDYLKSLHHFDIEGFKKISTLSYFKTMENTLRNKSIKHPGKFKAFDFDIKIKAAQVTKERFFVKIKSKSSKRYAEYWYILDRESKKLVISNYIHLEN